MSWFKRKQDVPIGHHILKIELMKYQMENSMLREEIASLWRRLDNALYNKTVHYE